MFSTEIHLQPDDMRLMEIMRESDDFAQFCTVS